MKFMTSSQIISIKISNIHIRQWRNPCKLTTRTYVTRCSEKSFIKSLKMYNFFHLVYYSMIILDLCINQPNSFVREKKFCKKINCAWLLYRYPLLPMAPSVILSVSEDHGISYGVKNRYILRKFSENIYGFL